MEERYMRNTHKETHSVLTGGENQVDLDIDVMT